VEAAVTDRTIRGADNPLATARDCILQHITPVPVLPDQKNPIIEGWQHLTITEENAAEYFNGADLNVGGVMGPKSNGLTDVDLDCVEALTLQKYFLPPTPARYGRHSKPESHSLYRCDAVEPKASVKWNDETKKVLVELRIGGGGKGAQSIMPGSRHPSGEYVRWDADGAPAHVEYADLKDAVNKLAVASLLMRHWPERNRNDTALGVGGFLARADLAPEAIFKIVRAVCLHRGDPSRAEHHAQTAASCVAAYQSGADTRGYPWLTETFGAGLAKQFAKFVAYRGEPIPDDGRPAIKLEAGKLSLTADKAEEVLVSAGIAFFERSNALVRPIIKEVDSFHGRKTMAAQFAKVDQTYMRDMLGRVAGWYKLDKRANRWDPVDVPYDVAAIVLARAGEWKFPTVVGIATAPTLRPDGTILDSVGYDAATRLLLVDSLAIPAIPQRPTKEDGVAALKLITDLLVEFPFVDAVAKAVAVSAIVTPIVRGAFAVAPMHVADAPVAASGKSYLFDVAAVIATGKRMPVIAAGRNEEETEKRLGAAVMTSQSLVCIDNVNGELRGYALAQLIERPRPLVRVLGRSELFEVEAGGTTFFADGNNIIVAGDLTRRVVRTRLDPRMEQPEMREFAGDPVAAVMEKRGVYVAAALTICRAYIAAGRPDAKKRLASFEGWSDTVRSALTWLGMEDPCHSMERIRADDPETSALRGVLTSWADTIGIGKEYARAASDIIATINSVVRVDPNTQVTTFANPRLRSAVLAALSGKRQLDAYDFGYWLRGRKNRVVNDMSFDCEADRESNKWRVVKLDDEGAEMNIPPAM
jgi:putative DNA primase/helicase